MSWKDDEEATFTTYARMEEKTTIAKEVRDTLGIKEETLVECRIR